MITSELLAAVKGEFPDLTDKTLRDWVKDGFLQPPERVGMGTDGTPNEWAADSVHRIKVLKSVTSKRVDKSRARKALIAAGFFIGAEALRDELIKQVDEVGYVYACTQSDIKVKDDRKGAVGVASSGKAGAMLMNKELGEVIASALIAPTFLTDKFFAALRCEAVNVVRDDGITRLLNMKDDTPLTKLLQVFSVYDLSEHLAHAPDSLLLDAFNDATNSFNMTLPIIGWLVGYDEYPPLQDSSILARYVQRRDTPIKLERYEFEYLLRLVCIAGCLIVALRKDELVRLLPEVLTYVLTYTHIEVLKSDTHIEVSKSDLDKLDESDMRVILTDGVVSTNNSSTINEFLTGEHEGHVAFAQSLLK